MKSFARATRLPDISGRGDYIANPERQERVVAASERVDWSEYAEYERYNQKTSQRNNEGREQIIMLPNKWAELPQAELHRRGELLAQTVVGKGREYQWAMHWNKTYTNFHIHIVFSERTRIKEPGVWDRNIYLSKDNKVARRKADRMTDADGNYILIHRKGEAKESFSAKDPKFATRKWLHEVKAEIRSKLEELGVRFERNNLLPEHHEGKGSDAPTIREKNEIIRENNRRLNCMAEKGLWVSELVKEAKCVRNSSRNAPGTEIIPVVIYDAAAEKFRVEACFSIDAAKRLVDQTKDFPEKVTEFLAAKEEKKAAPEKPVPETAQKPQKASPAAPAEERVLKEPPAPKPSERLRAAFESLKEALVMRDTAQLNLAQANAMWGWGQKKKEAKASASRELSDAQKECQDALNRMVSFGVSTYRDGVQITGTNLDPDDLKYLEYHVDWKINDLEGAEAHAAKAITKESLDDQISKSAEKAKEQESRTPNRTQKKADRNDGDR